MNVVSDEEVWLSYYTDFPLVSVRNFRVAQVLNEFGCMDQAFALLGESVIFPKCYTRNDGKSQLLRRALSDTGLSETLEALDDSGVGMEHSRLRREDHTSICTHKLPYIN
jgi:hypothetical protein